MLHRSLARSAALIFSATLLASCGSVPAPSPTIPATQTALPLPDTSPTPTMVAATLASSETSTPKPPTPTVNPPTATPAPEYTGPFRMVAPIDPTLLGWVTQFNALPDGNLHLVTTRGHAVLQDEIWNNWPFDESQIYIGTDSNNRDWFLLQGEENAIYYRIGDAEPISIVEGWLPLIPSSSLRGQGVVTDHLEQVWLVTTQDVRRFDGQRWTVFTREDMGMPPPDYEGVLTNFDIAFAPGSDQIWVGECDWTGPGPGGGGGARWFDGQHWQGAQSPTASGCVSAIRVDSAGLVWLVVESELWRYNPTSGEWTHLGSPQPPEGYRLGHAIDLSLDSSSSPWPLFALCGGASCVGEAMRYRFNNGQWAAVGQAASDFQILLFDASGTPWLFINGMGYQIEGDQLAQSPATKLTVIAGTVDAAGRMWLVGQFAGGPTAVWVLEPE